MPPAFIIVLGLTVFFLDEGRKAVKPFFVWRAGIFITTNRGYMSREEAIKTLLDSPEGESQAERIERIEKKLDLILSVIVVRQKDACEVAEVTPATVRNKVKRGEVAVLQADGSRSNYLTLQTTRKLKERRTK